MLQSTSSNGCNTSGEHHLDRADDIHSDDDDNEICVVETDEKPCSSDDSYTHLTTGNYNIALRDLCKFGNISVNLFSYVFRKTLICSKICESFLRPSTSCRLVILFILPGEQTFSHTF